MTSQMKSFRVFLTVLGLTLAPSHLRADNFLGWLNKGAKILEEIQAKPPAPRFSQSDLFGRPFDLTQTRGKIVLLAFLDRNSTFEAIEWLERQTTWLLHEPNLSFVNVFYPGGHSFLIPRGEVVSKIRKEINRSEKNLLMGLADPEVEAYKKADIHWLVDWKRQISRLYPVEKGRVNLFLIDTEGAIFEVHRYDPENPSEGLRKQILHLLSR